ncbi:MAG: AAA family ATPase [Rhodospirillaceae bacterium]|nr:AAA family ATPase [Rhodospirillaceae bacterium]
MLDPFLSEALRRLDRWLLQVCDEEERRARLLAGDGSGGWAGVRNLARPETAALAFAGPPMDGPLLPPGDHAFHRIGTALGLEACELEALLVALAPHVEPRYQSLYAVLQDDLNERRPTERVVLAVLGREARRRRCLSESLRPAGRLIQGGFLVREAGVFAPLACPLRLADDMLSALLGGDRPPIPGAAHQGWAAGEGPQAGRQAWQVIHGGGDRVGLARQLAGEGVRIVDVRVPPDGSLAPLVCRAAWRVGVAADSLPVIDLAGLDDHEALAAARSVEMLVRRLGGRAWLLARNPLDLSAPHVDCRPMAWSGRRDAWLGEARRRGTPLTVDAGERLATRHRLQPAEIREVFDRTPGDDEAALDQTAEHMRRAAVLHTVRLVPERDFDDLVVRDTTREALERLVFYVRNRDRVAEMRALEHRYQLQRGPIVLFSGRSGTGKTLAAEVIAKSLGRQLHVVDLARLVSKYIGETEKQIDDVLTQGEQASTVLLFDEADVLFSNRMEKASNASEHFANMVVGYLLQRIERHDGLVILSTNLRHAIDEAFLRRFQFRIEFPLPEPGERHRIWELMLPPGVERAGDIDIDTLAARHRLAGGEIRNAALKAIFLAEQDGRPVGQAHLERGVALELLELGRISRRPPDGGDAGGTGTLPEPDRGQLLRRCADVIQDVLEAYLRPRFLKEIHIVQGSPTDETLAGKRPAVSVALFRLARRRGAAGLRVGAIVSAWSHRAEEEHELLGVVHEALSTTGQLDLLGRTASLRVQESHDFDLLHRFWSSHDHPVRASVVLDVEID